jgi:hypothetical protein
MSSIVIKEMSMKRSYIVIPLVLLLAGNCAVAGDPKVVQPGLFDGVFSLVNSSLRIVTVNRSKEGNVIGVSVNPKNTAICAGTVFVLWKMSGHLADALYPYVLNALPSVGPIAHAQAAHALQKQEAAVAHEERSKAVKERIEKIKADQQDTKLDQETMSRL